MSSGRGPCHQDRGGRTSDRRGAARPLRTASSQSEYRKVADEEHPDHQLRVNRRPADLAVERFQLLPKLSQYPGYGWIDAAKKMMLRNTPLEVEEVEQLALIDRLPTHHDLASAAESLNRTES